MQNVILTEILPHQYDQEIRKAMNDFEMALKLLVLRGLPLDESHFVVRAEPGSDGKLTFHKFHNVTLR